MKISAFVVLASLLLTIQAHAGKGDRLCSKVTTDFSFEVCSTATALDYVPGKYLQGKKELMEANGWDTSEVLTDLPVYRYTLILRTDADRNLKVDFGGDSYTRSPLPMVLTLFYGDFDIELPARSSLKITFLSEVEPKEKPLYILATTGLGPNGVDEIVHLRGNVYLGHTLQYYFPEDKVLQKLADDPFFMAD